jgi:hypothetical protein
LARPVRRAGSPEFKAPPVLPERASREQLAPQEVRGLKDQQALKESREPLLQEPKGQPERAAIPAPKEILDRTEILGPRALQALRARRGL